MVLYELSLHCEHGSALCKEKELGLAALVRGYSGVKITTRSELSYTV